MNPKIIIHGGFFSESQTNLGVKLAKQNALGNIVKKSYDFLATHSALETVVFAGELLEDCELFNAGTGSMIQSDGKIRMSASVMDGSRERFSGVMNISDIKNPVRVAEKLMECEDRVLSGAEALNFARKLGFEFYNPETRERRSEYEQNLRVSKTGTVGCVALDKMGNLAAATSTGGKGFEIPGRVSDSATVAGNFANQAAAVSCTGVGEDIVNAALAAKIVTRVTDGLSLREAVEKSFAELKRYDGFAGIIAIDANGNFYHKDSFLYMVYALCDENGMEVFK